MTGTPIGVTRRPRWAAVALGVLVAGVALACQRSTQAGSNGVLAISGRTNQTPHIAAEGDRVAVSWVALNAAGAGDAYVAVSEDAGATFGTPVRVNNLEGEVRPSEQQSPRLAMRGSLVALLWTSRRGAATEVRLAMSRDGGRSFEASRPVSPAGAPGTRGWGALLIDDRQRVRATWLDTRLATASTDSATDRAAPHVHGASMPSTRQDVYTAVVDETGSVAERLIGTNVCFCCRTALVQSGSQIWGAWRDLYPGGVRDISFAHISEDGEVVRTRVSEDRWAIDGCPEDGPAMVADAEGHGEIVWPTLVSDPPLKKGIFHSTTDGRSFSTRIRLDSGRGSASHPSVAKSQETLLAAWDALEGQSRRVETRERVNGTWSPPSILDEGPSASSPSVAAVTGGFIVVWGRREPSGSTIQVRRVR